MRRFMVFLSAAAMMFASVPADVARATPPSDVLIAVETTIPDEGPSFGPFQAFGPAVDAGLICPTGDTVDEFGKLSGLPADTGFNIQVIKRFTCDDGSGDFAIKLQVRIDRKGTNFRWNVVDGSGAYEDLHGTGFGVGVPDCGPSCIRDFYLGGVHID